MRAFDFLATSMGISAFLLVPDVASADPLVCWVRPDHQIECERRMTCTVGMACESADDVCVELIIGANDIRETFCHPPCGNLFGCDSTNSGCPNLGFSDPSLGYFACLQMAGVSGSGAAGVCEYIGSPGIRFADPDIRPRPQITTELVAACYSYRGHLLHNWFEGDCDGDDCQNASDPTPWDTSNPTDPVDCPEIFHRGPICEQRTIPLDVEPVGGRSDGGTGDAGIRDAGTRNAGTRDAGAEMNDAGAPVAPDAAPGEWDAGPTFDAGASEPNELRYSGGGGFRCTFKPAAVRAGWSSWTVLVLLGLGIRSLRKRAL